MTDIQKWFGVRCLFRHPGAYEERVTIWPAESLDHAIEQAEEEARSYAEDVDAEYVDFAQAYGPIVGPDQVDPDEFGPGVEVFSLGRDSDLPRREYLDRFFTTGTEWERGPDD